MVCKDRAARWASAMAMTIALAAASLALAGDGTESELKAPAAPVEACAEEGRPLIERRGPPATPVREPTREQPPSNGPSPKSEPGNLALNPATRVSGRGWGGGAKPSELVDGIRHYGEGDWAHGLAATGGKRAWAGSTCGWRHVVVHLGRLERWARVMVWHHGANHVPNTYRIAHEAEGAWVTDVETARGREHLIYQHRADAKGRWWHAWSRPTEDCFASVRSSKLRFSYDNCDIEHGWLYEIEIYAEPDARRPTCGR